jgi:DNA helicase-2/ATP-dependent DNA helicase PcrA
MLDFAQKYSNTNVIVLNNNYRSSQDILNLSQNLINNNSQRISNRIKAVNKKLTAS